MGGDGGGTGASTSFDGMSHEQMLQWLDQANAGSVQAAADRLTAAAREIRSIAEELKIRPQWVEWKGEGADAFRTWSGDLANATLRLGDFSDGAAKWLGEASGAIARAQASIPRDRAGARANLDAATSTPNDPDAASIGAKSLRELAALDAAEEKVRQEAAAEMTKLGQAYRLSASQMEGLERPRFPPPPKAIQPAPRQIAETEVVPPGGGDAGTSAGRTDAGMAPSAQTRRVLPADGVVPVEDRTRNASITTDQRSLPPLAEPVGVEIDRATVLPEATSTSPLPASSGGSGEGAASQPKGSVPPAFGVGGGPRGPGSALGQGRAPLSERPALAPGRTQASPFSGSAPRSAGSAPQPGGPTRPVTGGRPSLSPGRGAFGAPPGRGPEANGGIVGGRATPPSAARPTNGLSRGTVVGGGATGDANRGVNSGSSGGTGAGGTKAARSGAGAASRPTGHGTGIVGGRPQRVPRARPLIVEDSALGGRAFGGGMPAAGPGQRGRDASEGETPSPSTERPDGRAAGADERTGYEEPRPRDDPKPSTAPLAP
ncbi:hypothetical protein ACIPJS_31820 [Streptomyces sp. NPDC086783]|uniref:hypothetical protein n=1 Tax=Streptomyces sp. NPDC086783 TaxID=3365758 RepID=UPI0037FE4837